MSRPAKGALNSEARGRPARGQRSSPLPTQRATELGADRLPRLSLLRARRPRGRRRPVRRAVQRAESARGGASGAGIARLAHPAGRSRAGLRAREGPSPAADAVAGERALRRRAEGVDPADAQPPRTRGDQRPAVRVRGRAQDRRAGDLADLPRRRVRARAPLAGTARSARTSPTTCAPCRRYLCGWRTRIRRRSSRCAARSTCRCRISPRSTSVGRRPGCRRS